MTTPTDDQWKNLKEHPGTYIVQDRSSQDELLRQHIQNTMYNTLMGGRVIRTT